MWGQDPTTIFAVGSPDYVMRFNGITWQEENHGLTLGSIRGVWGTSATDVFVVGTYGIGHRSSTGWQLQMSSTAGIYDVWGTSGSSVYAVGGGGAILHYDGATWQPMTSGTSSYLSQIWGTSDTNVYALGRNLLLHFDGTSWTPVVTGTQLDYMAIAGGGADDVFVLMADNTLLHWDGTRWAPVRLDIEPNDTVPRTIVADGSQWIIGGQAGILSTVEVPMLRPYLRTAMGGPGR